MAKESMTIREHTVSMVATGIKIVDVNEDLGSYVAADLRKTLEDLVSQKTQKIVVNLSRVHHINSTAVGALVGIAKRLRQKDGDLKVCGLADNLKRTFDLIGASSVLEIYDSESSALAKF
ncbi:STAS domain-containing protein [Candidatus Poribacteria bacterium]|nr:STAS domain-containing protein [Candidatus Poribacteria bacterium]